MIPEWISADLEQALGRPPIDLAMELIWVAVKNYESGASLIDDLVEEYEHIDQALRDRYASRGEFGTSSRRRSTGPGIELDVADWRPDERLALRSEVLSELVADVAAQTNQVRAFRDEHLEPDGLLRRQEVEAWVRSRLPRSRTTDTVVLEWLSCDGRGNSKDPRRLSERRDLVDRAGPLGALKFLADWLSNRYWWSVPEALWFVLTDDPPAVVPLHAAYQGRHVRDCNAGTRLVLEVDPIITPKQLVEWYRVVRADALVRRYQPQSEKHLQLARFTRQRDGSWPEIMGTWNRENPQWKYADPSKFGRDARHARARLLKAAYRWKPHMDV